jgi:hypothetical protein
VAVVNKVLSLERPELVVLNGDLTNGDNTYVANSTNYIDEIVRPLVQHNLPWAALYGNHDYQHNITGRTILERENTYPNSLTKSMVDGEGVGNSNYYLEVFGAKKEKSSWFWSRKTENKKDHNNTDEERPVLRLWFFDSRGGYEYQKRDAKGALIPVGAWVHEDVVKWFETTNAKLQAKDATLVPSIGFVHYPTNASSAIVDGNRNVNTAPGISDDKPLDHQSIENKVYTGKDVPFMQAVLKTPGLLALFSAHQHGTDWCDKWDSVLPGMQLKGNGLNLCFGRHTGYGGYGNWIRGSRQVIIDQDMLTKQHAFETYTRLENGDVQGRVMLNSTYGTDLYPAVLI